MKHTFRLIAISLSFAGFASAAVGQEMSVTTATTSGSATGAVTISASPLHALGPDAISVVAFELNGPSGSWTLPPANDGGQSGDTLAGDGVWSVSTDLPNITSGSYALVVYVVDTGGAEFISTPFDVTLN